MKRSCRQLSSQGKIKDKNLSVNLTPSDKAVLKYLSEMLNDSDDETYTVSISRIAMACDISKRQVQISTGRLISTGLIERIGYDFGNPDKTRRGAIYKGLKSEPNTKRLTNERRRTIKLLLLWSEDE